MRRKMKSYKILGFLSNRRKNAKSNLILFRTQTRADVLMFRNASTFLRMMLYFWNICNRCFKEVVPQITLKYSSRLLFISYSNLMGTCLKASLNKSISVQNPQLITNRICIQIHPQQTMKFSINLIFKLAAYIVLYIQNLKNGI